MSHQIAPQPSEFELSLFGPGIGECAVVHLGNGDWMVVDSCLDEDGDLPIALAYLDGLGVDVGSQVKLILATHWHDDHIRGMSQLVQSATSARFACSAALRSEEFFALVAAHDDVKLVEHTSGVSEFADVLQILQSRVVGRYAVGPDHWACEGVRLYSGAKPQNVEVFSVSPSPQTITDSKGHLAELLPTLNSPIRRFATASPNDMSVVLIVTSAKGPHLLLGADLENGKDDRRGWRYVINSPLRPKVLSHAYKVAHHGSATADLDAIWSQLLVANSHALITPYARGHSPLPSDRDVERMKSTTAHAYCTAWPLTTRPSRRRGVDRTMNEVARVRRAIRKCPGQIRLRVPIGGQLDDVSIELLDGATRL